MIITIATEKIQTDRESKENVLKIVCKTLDVLCFNVFELEFFCDIGRESIVGFVVGIPG